LSHKYLREFSKKFEMAVMVYSGAWEKLIHEKNQKSKISWHCPGIDSWALETFTNTSSDVSVLFKMLVETFTFSLSRKSYKKIQFIFMVHMMA
jgi:hypothetical protein